MTTKEQSAVGGLRLLGAVLEGVLPVRGVREGRGVVLAEVELVVELVVLDLDVLIEGAFGAVGALAGVDGAAVVPLDLVGRPAEPLLLVIVAALPLLDIAGLALELGEAAAELVALVEELAHLGEQHHVGEVQSAELVVIAKVSVLLHIISLFQTTNTTAYRAPPLTHLKPTSHPHLRTITLHACENRVGNHLGQSRPLRRVDLKHPPHQFHQRSSQALRRCQLIPRLALGDDEAGERLGDDAAVAGIEGAEASHLAEHCFVRLVGQKVALVEQQFREEQPKAPNVYGEAIGGQPVDHFWRLVALGPEVVGLELALRPLRESEVEEPRAPGSHEHVGGLDIAVHHSQAVHELQSAGDGEGSAQGLLVGDGGDELVERHAGVELVDEREGLAGRVVERVQQLHEPHLFSLFGWQFLQSLQEQAVDPDLLLDRFGGQFLEHLDHHRLPGQHVHTLEDARGGALAQRVQNFVVVAEPPLPLLRLLLSRGPVGHPAGEQSARCHNQHYQAKSIIESGVHIIVMGGGQSVEVQCEEMRENEWQEEERERVFGRCRTLRNRRTGAMADEYQLSWASQQEYEFYLKSFNWRARRRTPAPVVCSLFLRPAARADFCSQKFSANVYLEHVGLRLSQVEEVPLGEALYVLGEALEGFQQLYDHSGYFRIREEQICVDRAGRVKVWVNADLARNYPDCDTDCGRNQKDEVDMVEQLLEIVSAATDPEEMPAPSLLQFFDLVRKREVVDIGFEYARILVVQFARLHQARIPERFETVIELLYPSPQKNYSVSNYVETLPSSSIDLLAARSQWGSPRLNPSSSMPCIHPPSNSTSRQSQPNRLPQPIYPPLHAHSFAHPADPLHPADPFASQQLHAQQSLRLEQINSRHFEESSGQQTKRKSGNSKNSHNSKSQLEEAPSLLFLDPPAEDRDTLRSVPNRRGRRRPNMEQIIYSQCIGEGGHNGRGGFGVPPRRRLQESTSSNRFASSNSSQYRNSQRLSRNSKKSAGSRRDGSPNRHEGPISRNESGASREDPLRTHLHPPRQMPKRALQFYSLVGEEWELDPEIEADIRRYLGE